MTRRRYLKQEEKKKRDILPSVIAFLLCIFFGIFIVYFIDPSTFLIIPVFFLLSFLAIFFLLSVFIEKVKTKMIMSLAFLIFMIFKYFKMGNVVNFFLLIAITATILLYERYSQKTN